MTDGLLAKARGLLAVLVLSVFGLSSSAPAQPACADATKLPNPVYLTVGDTQINLMQRLGAELRRHEQITLIWRATASSARALVRSPWVMTRLLPSLDRRCGWCHSPATTAHCEKPPSSAARAAAPAAGLAVRGAESRQKKRTLCSVSVRPARSRRGWITTCCCRGQRRKAR